MIIEFIIIIAIIFSLGVFFSRMINKLKKDEVFPDSGTYDEEGDNADVKELYDKRQRRNLDNFMRERHGLEKIDYES